MATTKKTSKISAVIPAVDPTPAPLKSVDQAPSEDGALEATAPEATEASTMIRKKDFIERIVAESGAKKGDVRLIAETALKVLGDALSNGEALNLPPLGRAKITRTIDKNDGEVLVIKLRRNTPNDAGEKTSSEPLADADE
jgi:hypothetical protein